MRTSTGVLLVMMAALGCASFQDDGFRQRLKGGCNTETDCSFLVEQATERDRRCRQAPLRDCEETGADLGTASRIARAYEVHADERRRAQHQQARIEHEEQERAERAEREAKYATEQIEERERWQDRENAEKRRVERLKVAAHDPEYLLPILSMQICDSIKQLHQLSRDLAEEIEIERRSGVRDLSERRDIAESQLDAEQRRRELKARLTHMSLKPLPCDAAYEHLAQCVQGVAQAPCDDVRTIVEIMQSNVEI